MSDKTDEILFERRGPAGLVTLNRPQALNAVTLGMVRALHAKLDKWARNDKIHHVVVRAVGGKAFSAGGDIRNLYDWGRSGNETWRDFYREEYRLNAAIKHYGKPYVALIDGIVMGGGVGISVHGSHRVATEKLMFAMPEVGIGMFPDVGGSWFLPRLPGEVGTYLALTGARVGLEDARWTGIANHGCPSDRIGDLVEELCAATDVDAVIAKHGVRPKHAPLARLQADIDRVFSKASIEEILAALDAEGEVEWAKKAAAAMRRNSPTSMKVALRQLREGKRRTEFDDCMRMEYRVVERVMRGHDFFEGVRAQIIDKDNAPNWQPATLAELSDEAVGGYFAPLAEGDLGLES